MECRYFPAAMLESPLPTRRQGDIRLPSQAAQIAICGRFPGPVRCLMMRFVAYAVAALNGGSLRSTDTRIDAVCPLSTLAPAAAITIKPRSIQSAHCRIDEVNTFPASRTRQDVGDSRTDTK